jgi:hypothetical protein
MLDTSNCIVEPNLVLGIIISSLHRLHRRSNGLAPINKMSRCHANIGNRWGIAARQVRIMPMFLGNARRLVDCVHQERNKFQNNDFIVYLFYNKKHAGSNLGPTNCESGVLTT